MIIELDANNYCKFDNDVFGFTFEINDDNSAMSKIVRYKEKGFVILSACKEAKLPRGKRYSEFTEEEKNHYEELYESSRQLEKDIRQKGLGFLPTLGGYPEEVKGESDKFVDVNELSYIVPYREDIMTEEEFYNWALEIGKKYNQDSILVCLPNITNSKPTYIKSTTKGFGKEDGSFNNTRYSVGEDDPYYTEFKRKYNKGNTLGTGKGFVFEDSKTFITDSDLTKNYFGIARASGAFSAHSLHLRGNILSLKKYFGE